MAISRYENFQVILSKLQTFPYIDPRNLYSDNDIYVEWGADSRMDILASEFMGDGQYWWIIMLLNGFKLPFGIPVGSIVRIPSNPQIALDAINFALNQA